MAATLPKTTAEERKTSDPAAADYLRASRR